MFYTVMLCMFVLCCGIYIKKPRFLKVKEIFTDTFIDSGLYLSKVRKTVFRDSQSKTMSLLLLLLVCGDIEPHPDPTCTDMEKLHIEELPNLLKHRGIKIFHQNVRGLLTNIDKVKILFRDFKNLDIRGRGVVVITTAQLHSTKPELRFWASSNPARGGLEIRDGEAL